MNKTLPAFSGYSQGSEEGLEKQARSMLRGLVKHKRAHMWVELIGLCKPVDVRATPSVTARAPLPATSTEEEETVKQAEEWDEGEEEDWDDGGDWMPPPACSM